MNFWIFREDHSRGYYDAVQQKKYKSSGSVSLLYSLFFLISQLFRLAGSMLLALGFLLVTLIRWIRKVTR